MKNTDELGRKGNAVQQTDNTMINSRKRKLLITVGVALATQLIGLLLALYFDLRPTVQATQFVYSDEISVVPIIVFLFFLSAAIVSIVATYYQANFLPTDSPATQLEERIDTFKVESNEQIQKLKLRIDKLESKWSATSEQEPTPGTRDDPKI